jgi:ABC-type spermidine/putrescine transport system permease subunit II
MPGSARDAEVVARHATLARRSLTAWAMLVYLFLFAPVALLVLFSFNANRYGTLPITGWTLQWYRDVFNNYQIQDATRTTLKVAAQVTVLATVIGTAAAFPLARARLRFRTAIRAGFMLPIMIPGLLIGVGLLTLFTSYLSVQLSTETAVIGQTVYTTPFVMLIVASRLQSFDRKLEVAASDLGANLPNRLRHIVLPLILPSVLAGALFAFTLSLDEFIITLFLIGGQNTLPIYIYTQVKFGITPEVNALATMLLAATLALSLVGFGLPALIRSLRGVRAGRAG